MSSHSSETTSDEDQVWDPYNILDSDTDNTTPPDESHPWDMLSSEEQQLTMQWSDALQIDHRLIKPTDNFFELGGDSMTAMQLATDMPSKGKSLLVSDVFKAPTLADMARAAIESAVQESDVGIEAFSLLDSETDVSSLLKKASSQCQLDTGSIEDIYPCTHLQKGVMALSLLHPGIYMEQHVYSIPCSWDLDSFKNTWSAVVRSCDVLRTRIVHIDSSEWFQVVDHGALNWTCASDVKTYLENDQKCPMGLGESLIRCAIVESESPKFVLTIHHAVEDGWSLKMITPLVNEAHRNGDIACLGSFKSFIKYLSKLDNGSSRQHWQSQLDGASPSTFPPLPSPTHQPRADREISHFIPLKKNSSLRTTLSTSIRAAWAILQSRYLDDDTVVYGETLSGRHVPLPNIGKIFGPTITTVPVRLTIDKDKSVSYTLDHINNQYANMMAYEQFGLHNIQALGDSARRACAFQSLLVIHPDRDSKEPQGDEFSEISLGLKNYLSYGLTVECQLATDGVSLEMSFDPGVISDMQVKRINHQFTHVLCQIYDPSYSDTALKDIEITSPEDKVEIMKWNDGLLECLEECVFDAIEKKSQHYLDSLAIDSWDGKVSYRQLSDWSSSLAAILAENEVGPEKYVALCFEKSMWTVVAMMAVMKAGGAFVLLDRTQPVTRLQKIVQAVDATLLLSSTAQFSLCTSFFDKVLAVEPNELKLQSIQPANTSHSIVSPRNAVYVTFTSGSTGEPKGIVIEHRNCLSGFEAQINRGLFSRDSRVLQFTSYSFDTCIEDILATLLAGGCICVPRDEDRLHDLPRVINAMNVNLVQTTTSAASLISPGSVPTLRALRQGGEPMAGSLIDRWAGAVQVENSYGPSECTVTSSIQSLPHSGNPTNIGNGVGCLLWIAESTDSSRLAPIGTTGELLIQGPIVGRGYINRNEATAANFVSNSFLPETAPSAAYRVYRTGDMARYNDDGTINIIGRKDNQVKLHGQRIELGDIESHLLGHEYVKTAVAELPVAGALAGIIVAVVQLHDNIKDSDQESIYRLELFSEEKLSQYSENLTKIRNRLRTSLPSYMVPTVIIPVRYLPTLVTGKLDRKSTKTWLSEFTWEQKAMIDRVSSNADPLSEIPSDETLALDLNKRLSKLLVGDNKNIMHSIENRDFLLKSVGLDSIKVVSLSRILQQEYGLKVPIKVLNSSSLSVRGLARHIIHAKLGQRSLELSQLDVTGELSNLKALLDGNDCGTVLLTGATGYLGAHILKFLLKSDRTTRVIAHVRAQSHEQGLGRVMRAAQMAKWWDSSLSEKLEIWPGDLGQPRLGLSSKLWNRLIDAPSPEETVNCVVHCGAMVNWSNDYHSLKSANVMSTLDLLRCARLSGAVQKFVYISGGPQWDPIREDTDELLLKQLKLTDNGYGQSKIMSELLVRTYAANPAQTSTETSIIKPGFIIGSPDTGVVNSDDFIWRMVATVIAIGGYDKESVDSWIFVTSADRIVELVLDGLLHDANKSLAVQKVNEGITVGELWIILGEHFGYELRPMNHLDWAAALKNDIEKSMERHPLWPVYHLVEQNFCALGYDGEIAQDLLESDRHRYVKSSVISSVEYLIKIGFLPNPKGNVPISSTEVTFDRSRNHF